MAFEMQSLTSVFVGNPTRIIITVLIGFLVGKSRRSQLKPSIFHCLLGETSQAIGAAGDASLRFALEMSWSCTRLGFLGENVTLVMLPGKSWRIGGYLVEVTPLKTNMSPENRWLEDVFPTEMVTF